MKSILKIKILGIDYNTAKKVSISKTIECDGMNFVDRVIPPMKISNGKYGLPETIVTAKEQADGWFSNQSKLLNSIIYDQELICIVNWDVISIENIGVNESKSFALAPKAKKVKLSDIEKIEMVFKRLENEVQFTPELRDNFLHTYLEMKDVLGGISTEKKILIVLRSLGIGLMAATNAYDSITAIYREFDKKDTAMIEEADYGK